MTLFQSVSHNGDYMEIGLTKVLWKTVLGLINLKIGAAATYHDALHGFR